MTIIEIRNGWEVFESAGVQPVFLSQEQAIDYATGFIGWVETKRTGEQALNRQIGREQRSQGAGES
jgi:hypothetical protein